MVVLLACSTLAQAQDDPTDSVSTIEEEIVAPPVVQEETTTTTRIRTVLPSPPEFRAVPDSTVRRFKNSEDFEYANDPEYWDIEGEKAARLKREKEERERQRRLESQEYKKGFWDYFNSFFSGTAIRIITYIALSLFFLFVIYRIMVVNKLFLFYHSKKTKVQEDGEAVDIEDDNLDEKIRKAAQTGEHRQAVRFMYLKALQLLNDRQWIRYHVDATNYEYVIQMSSHKLGNDFSFLTRIYDYMWYGEFALTNEQFDVVYNNFNHFYNAVNA